MLSLTHNFYIIDLKMMSRTFFKKKRPGNSGPTARPAINTFHFKNKGRLLYYAEEGQMKVIFVGKHKELSFHDSESRKDLAFFYIIFSIDSFKLL